MLLHVCCICLLNALQTTRSPEDARPGRRHQPIPYKFTRFTICITTFICIFTVFFVHLLYGVPKARVRAAGANPAPVNLLCALHV